MDQGITLDGGGLSRWRGEHAAGQSTGVQIPGLSRWRGNTRQGTITEVRTTVYPRWRGEHTKHT
ncbi:hypothetical protein SE959_06580 [Escherichia coli]|nr:hypothetical protein [Escherichia coli]